ncbi:MAG: alginate lyase family protein [Chloroflexi bacterium]|nr:alginate lyase family protein [Chloroflexota bacterium]MCY4248199.1 alginate lyase family protein [Chloroflexota bacterium]
MTRAPSLFFSTADLQLARENLQREPVKSALTMLDSPPAEPLAKAQILALRHILRGEREAGAAALTAIRELESTASDARNAAHQQAMSRLSTLAMLRDLPGGEAALEVEIAQLPLASPQGDALATYWAAVVAMAVGCLRDDDAHIDRATASYRQAIDQHIHPEGYIRGVVDMEHKQTEPHGYQRQLSATCALVLIAEMASQRNIDLWAYDNRAVSIHTAAAYTHYYYWFPERWPWGEGLTRAQTEAALRREGAFYEMVNRHQPPRGIETLFAEQRPLFCAYGGGLTTLTHGAPRPQKRRWKLW